MPVAAPDASVEPRPREPFMDAYERFQLAFEMPEETADDADGSSAAALACVPGDAYDLYSRLWTDTGD